jgi:hypothetical protein
LADARIGDHVCWTYDDRSEFVAGLAVFVREGLASGDRVACYLAGEQLDDIVRELEASVPRAAKERASGALVISSFEDAYQGDGAFDPAERLRGYVAAVREALAGGFTALRAIGQASVILRDPSARDLWPGYELGADLLAATLPFIGVCAYERGACDAEALRLLNAVHGRSYGRFDADASFHLHATPHGELAIAGEIDSFTAADVSRLAWAGPLVLSEAVIDVAGLRFIDSAGMRAVVEHAQALATSNDRIEFRGAGHAFRRLWNLLDCDSRIDADLVLA